MSLDDLLCGAMAWLLLMMLVLAVTVVRAGEVGRRLVCSDLTMMLYVGVLALVALQRHEVHQLPSALALALLSFMGSLVIAAHAAQRE